MALVGLLLAAAPSGATVPGAVVRDAWAALDLAWLTPPDRAGRGKVKFQEEAEDAGYQRKINGRSLEGAAGVDCATVRFQLSRLVVYPQSRLRGEPVLQFGERPEWREPEPDTTMGRVMLAACGPPPLHRPALMQTSHQTPGERQFDGTAVAEASDRPPPRPPNQTALSELIATQQSAPPQPDITPPSSIPRPSNAVTAAGLQAKIEQDPPQRSVGAPVSVQNLFQLQLAALSSRERAEEAWRRMVKAQPALLGTLPERVTLITANSARYYRLLVGGFSTPNAAQGLCKDLGIPRSGCLIRAASD